MMLFDISTLYLALGLPFAPFFKAVAVTCCDGFLFLFEAVE